MRRLFIETREFTAWIRDHLGDAAYGEIQRKLEDTPELGDVMPGCGGLRKLRTADPARGKGKRGGARIIYLDVPQAGRTYMIDAYGKNEKDDLNAREKAMLARLAGMLKQEAIAAVARGGVK